MDETDKASPQAVPNWAGWVVAGAFIVVVAGCAVLLGSDSSGGLDEQHRDATRVCEGFVKDRILNPAGAEFSDETASGVGTAAGGVTVTGIVDSVTRQRFRCSVVINGGQWRLTALTVS